MVMCSCSPFHFYHIELTHPRIYLRNENVNKLSDYSFIGAISFGGCSYGDMWCCSSILK